MTNTETRHGESDWPRWMWGFMLLSAIVPNLMLFVMIMLNG